MKLRRTKGFVFGVIVTALCLVGAARLGLVEIDITVTQKGSALIEDGKVRVEALKNDAVELFSGVEVTEAE